MPADPRGPTELLRQTLPPALEVITAWVAADDDGDPAMFSAALDRVIGDAAADAEPQRACARLLFGMASLAGLLTDELATRDGRTREEVLQALHARYLGEAM